MFKVTSTREQPIRVTVLIEQQEVTMEIDTGASLSLINEDTWRRLGKDRSVLQESQVHLQTYTGEEIPILRSCSVTVQYKDQSQTLSVIVVPGRGPNLLGRDWLAQLKLDWETIFWTQCATLAQVLNAHKEVFDETLGKLKDFKAKLFVDSQAKPVFYKPRQVPQALKQKIEAELTNLEQKGIIQPVKYSNWAAPVVPILKPDGTLRLCGDYRVTVNKFATESYPLPRIEELFSSLAGRKSFSKLDLSHAYLQIELDELSKEYVTFNTHRGLYKYNRLPFGVSSAPAIFQRVMENVLQGLPKVCVYIDDILVTGETELEHLQNFNAVLECLKTAGMHLKQNKCKFMLPEVEYLGHIISAAGLKPSQSKVEAIEEAPVPTNVSELKSFLGLVNYYSKFLPNLASSLAPLYQLLNKNTKWMWTKKQAMTFQAIKTALKSSSLLVHFDNSLPLILSCDASPYGVGAVLSHKMSNNVEKPIAFASRSLAAAEKTILS